MKLWITLCTLLVFAAGSAVGYLAGDRIRSGHAVSLPSPPAETDELGAIVDPDPDYPLYLVTSESVYDELALSPDQRERLENLLAIHFDRLRDVRAELTSLSAELRCGVLDVLSEEQAQRFQAVRSRFSESRVQSWVDREIAKLRRELHLVPEQVAGAYGVLFEWGLERKDLFGRKRAGTARTGVLEELEGLRRRRDERLQAILSPEQFSSYVEIQARERRCREGNESAGSSGQKAACPDTKKAKAAETPACRSTDSVRCRDARGRSRITGEA